MFRNGLMIGNGKKLLLMVSKDELYKNLMPGCNGKRYHVENDKKDGKITGWFWYYYPFKRGGRDFSAVRLCNLIPN
jgi:hypothetical protein